MQELGRKALTLAISGVITPTAIGAYWHYCVHLHTDSLSQGIAEVGIICLCLLALLIMEVIALCIGLRSRATLPGLCAVVISTLALVCCVGMVVCLFVLSR